MAGDEIRIIVTKEGLRKILEASGESVSSGISDVIEEYSEKVDQDVLENFIRERR